MIPELSFCVDVLVNPRGVINNAGEPLGGSGPNTLPCGAVPQLLNDGDYAALVCAIGEGYGKGRLFFAKIPRGQKWVLK